MINIISGCDSPFMLVGSGVYSFGPFVLKCMHQNKEKLSQIMLIQFIGQRAKLYLPLKVVENRPPLGGYKAQIKKSLQHSQAFYAAQRINCFTLYGYAVLALAPEDGRSVVMLHPQLLSADRAIGVLK